MACKTKFWPTSPYANEAASHTKNQIFEIEDDFELYRQARLLFEAKYEKCLSFLEKRGLHLRHYGDSAADGQKLISARLKQFGVSEGDFSSADHGEIKSCILEVGQIFSSSTGSN